jgi:RNA polymerase sigma-70 factor (sigma-E family)
VALYGSEVALDGEAAPPSDDGIEDLYAREYEAMLRLAYLLIGRRAEAEDAVHDAFEQLHARWSTVRAPAAYLRTCVVNASRGQHRRRAREQNHFAELVSLVVSDETPFVMDALMQLPYKQRAALVLRYYEDRPEPEIASILECRPATVRSIVHRGLASLRKAFES